MPFQGFGFAFWDFGSLRALEERMNRAHTRNGVLICIPDLMVIVSTSNSLNFPNEQVA